MKATPLSEEIYHYIVNLVGKDEEALLSSMMAHSTDIPHIMISPEQARFIGFFRDATRDLSIYFRNFIGGHKINFVSKTF